MIGAYYAALFILWFIAVLCNCILGGMIHFLLVIGIVIPMIIYFRRRSPKRQKMSSTRTTRVR